MARENLSADTFTTKCGIKPNMKELPFSLTTEDVERYLQRKIDAAFNAVNKKDHDANVKSVDVRIISRPMGKNFCPFFILIPEDGFKNRGGKVANKNRPAIFDKDNYDDHQTSVKLDDILYEVIRCYMYDRADVKAFDSEAFRRQLGVSRETARKLRKYSSPKVSSFDNGRMKRAFFMIDPVKVFYDMLMSSDDNRRYSIEINKFTKIQDGSYTYDMERVISKHNKKNRDLIADFDRIIRGR